MGNDEMVWKELCQREYSQVLKQSSHLIINEKGYKRLFIQQLQIMQRYKKGLHHLTCLEGHLSAVQAMCFSKLKKQTTINIPTLFSGDMKACLCQWDLRSTLQMKSIDFHSGDEGKILKIFDYEPQQVVGESDVVMSISPHNDQCEKRHLCLSCSSGNESDGSHSSLIVFDPSDGVVKYFIHSGLNESKSGIESKVSDFEHFNVEWVVNSTSNNLNVWKLVDEKYERIHQIESISEFHNYNIAKIVKLTSSSKLVATSGLDSFVCISNIENGEVIGKVSTLHTSPINNSLRVLNFGEMVCLLSVDMNGSVVMSYCKEDSMEDIKSWKQYLIAEQSNSGRVKITCEVTQRSDEEFIISISYQDKTLQVISCKLRFEDGKLSSIHSLQHNESLPSSCTNIVLTPEKLICSCRDCTVRLFYIGKSGSSLSLTETVELDCSGSQCNSMLLIPDQSILLLGLSDSAIFFVKFSPRYEWEYPSDFELGTDDLQYDHTNHAYLKIFKDFSIDHAKPCTERKPIQCVTFLEGIFDDKLIGTKFTKNTSYLIHNLLSEEECQHLIEQTEKLSYEDLYGYAKEYRSNKRVIVEDKISAQILFERVKSMAPQVYVDPESGDTWDLAFLNSRWRFCKYTPGQHFLAPHYDGCIELDGDTRSFYTFMFYLNGDYEEGRTTFIKSHTFPPAPPFEIKGHVEPEPGLCIIFPHNILHYGSVLKSGTKYLMRSELIYKRRKN
ncbi:2OG-Fe(II) oxygenase family protein [Naegleria gruberi]|uniref:2OG-Fe(II) oxygenase family protein n=1 Tax=Naegleria gruberi TaxID=5762 RepID=D2V353_NAEGR|nr:2OG-Fe(II) oxygenase family protein [Naegleria gruberi]EFC48717.1 2OG-Fe(II) oxygenase family protein [Naegleria gruberi]|eukprot:XP_002681461.1 2OG-Fe(II) oxygenase family protein [Naegleria gruberi strain NEG-M]